MFMLNDKPLGPDIAFTTEDGTQYPANWLRLASAEEKAAIGITEVPDPEVYDDRFYWGVGNPKDVEMVHEMLMSQLKAAAYSMLQPTDYVDLRNLRDPSYQPEVMLVREAIRTAYTANVALVAAATTTEELAAIQFTWPAAE